MISKGKNVPITLNQCQVVWQGKNHMDVGRLEHRALPGREPGGVGSAMTFGATTVPARVVRLHCVPTVVALRDVSPKGGSPAHGDGPQGPVLRAREGVAIAGQTSYAMLVHDIGHFKWRRMHGSWSTSAGKARASRGLAVACSAG
jgi:hypothetical protein